MGGKVSTELHVDEKALYRSKLPSFRGAVVLINHGKRPVPLDRPLRVALQLRNTMILQEVSTGANMPKMSDIVQTVWCIGDDQLVPSKTMLKVGENRFDFEFPTLADKLQEPLPNERYWKGKFGSFKRMKYEYIIRAGSAPQAKDVLLYPKLASVARAKQGD